MASSRSRSATSLVPVFSLGKSDRQKLPYGHGQQINQNFHPHTHIHSHKTPALSQLPICAFLSNIYPSGRTLARFAPSLRYPRFVCPLLHPNTAHATEEDWCRSREQGDFSFSFSRKSFLHYPIISCSDFFFSIYLPFLRSSILPCVYFPFSSLVSFLLRGRVSFGPCNDSHHVLFFFLLLFL